MRRPSLVLSLFAMGAALAALPWSVRAEAEPETAPEQLTPPPRQAPSRRPLPAFPGIGTPVELLLSDGQLIHGRFAGYVDGGVQLEVGGQRITVPFAVVKAVGAPGRLALEGPRLRDSNRTRYLYSPSGFMLNQGEGYLSQTELLLSSVAYGVTDWLLVQAGTVLPILAYDPRSTPAIFAVKAGFSPMERLHLAGGFQSFMLPTDRDPMVVGFLFGTATWGTEDLHFGISAGPPWVLSGAEKEVGNVLVSLSANWRAFRHGALVTENWIFTGGGSTHVVTSAAYRFLAERIAVDIGLIWADPVPFPVPWLDFTWHFGT